MCAKQITFSIIIPHKNTPELLQKCLDSIPHREDVQIIVVDDNSDVDKVDFQNFPGIEDELVEVFLTKEGKGAGYARNVGLKHAIGKWIAFADADDFFTSGIYDALSLLDKINCDVVFFKNMSVRIPTGVHSYRGEELNRRVDIALSSRDYSEAILYSSPWQKFFNAEMLFNNNISFNEVRCGNDIVFMGRVAAAAKSMTAFDKVIYCVTESDNSIIKDISLDARIIRFGQECENVRILRKTIYCNNKSVYYWLFNSWMAIWKIDRCCALKELTRLVYSGGFRVCIQMAKAKFI